jgi:putative phage-type endonuclease
MLYQELLDRVTHIQTDNMSYEEWLEKRKGSIGGSDAGAIMGYAGEWGSPLTVFLQKMSYASPKGMSNAAYRGKLLEPVIREYMCAEYPVKLDSVPYMFYHPEHSFISANIDGILYIENPIEINGKEISGIGGLEIKTTKTGYGYGENEIPDGHFCQVQHYMAVTGLNWFVLAVYFLENEEVKYYVIERHNDFIADLIKKEVEFWNNHIVANEWPAAIGIDSEEDMITGMFAGGDTIALGEEERALCCEHVELNAQEKEIKKRKDEISTNLKAIIVRKTSGSAERKISCLAGPYTISWLRYETSRVDSDALRQAGLYEKYVKKSETGRFTITEKKGA